MTNLWQTINEAQATVISGILTILAATAGVMLGGWIFGGRVNNLKAALESSQKAIDEHSASVNHKLSSLLDNLKEVETQLTGTTEAIGQLRGSVGDLQSSSAADTAPADQIDAREKLRADWTAIRDSLEKLVADPAIDGRTRAKYARIDRRQYGELLESFHNDFGMQNVTQYRRAMAIWHRYKNGKLTPTAQDLGEIAQIRAVLAP